MEMMRFLSCQIFLAIALCSSSAKETAQPGMVFLKTVLSKIQDERAELLADQEEESFVDVTPPSLPYNNLDKSDVDSTYLYFPPGNETLYVTTVKTVQPTYESSTLTASTSPSYPPIPEIKDEEDLFSILFSPQNDPFAQASTHEDENQDGIEESTNQLMSYEDNKLNDKDQMYQYYYVPLSKLKDLPPDLAQGIKAAVKKEKPIKPVPMIKTKPMPNNKVKNKMKNPVTPLFRAISMFIGTAMIFVVTILLMPRVRLVKVRSLDWENEKYFYSENSRRLDFK